MTPEGRVKKMVKDSLKKYGEKIYQHWPVLNGMGKPELDCNLIVMGYSISIETKSPGERMTKRQKETTRLKRAASGHVFEVDSKFDMGFVLAAIDSIFTYGNDDAVADYELSNMENKNG